MAEQHDPCTDCTVKCKGPLDAIALPGRDLSKSTDSAALVAIQPQVDNISEEHPDEIVVPTSPPDLASEYDRKQALINIVGEIARFAFSETEREQTARIDSPMSVRPRSNASDDHNEVEEIRSPAAMHDTTVAEDVGRTSNFVIAHHTALLSSDSLVHRWLDVFSHRSRISQARQVYDPPT